jgi:3-oxoacyl-[acyl-carrier protein] reductase
MSTSVAIVTGASQGIGRSTAIRLARDFSSIVLAARDRPNLEKTADAVKAAGAEPLVIDTDLSEIQAAKSWSIKRSPHSAGSMQCSTSPARCRRSTFSR